MMLFCTQTHNKKLWHTATYGIQFKPTKSTLLSTSRHFRHLISSEGRKPTNSGITAIADMLRPITPT